MHRLKYFTVYIKLIKRKFEGIIISIHSQMFFKIGVLKISQYSQENIFVGA